MRTTLIVLVLAALPGSAALSAAQASRLEDEAVEVGPGITPPSTKQRTDALYPADVRAKGIGGTVVVRAVIDRQGGVHRVEVLSSPDKRLSNSARNAMIRRRYEPATRDGQPLAVWWQETFRFLTEAEEIEQFASCDPAKVDSVELDPARGDESASVVLPVLVRNARIVKPERMTEERRIGRVVLECLIDVCGRVSNCRAVEPAPEAFTEAAIEGVQKRLYRPATLHGKPTEIYFTIRVDFR